MKISKHFSMSEFDCNDGTKVPNMLIPSITRLVKEVLQPLRNFVDKPIRIVSGYRTPEYNKRVGGATKSQHLLGTAADIEIIGLTIPETDELVLKYMHLRRDLTGKGGGVGWYSNSYTHVDVRNIASITHWNRRE